MNKRFGNIILKVLFAALLLSNSAAMAQRETGTPNSTNASTQHVTIGGSVFGGGNLAPVSGNTEVRINQLGAIVENDVYGGGALADVGTNNNNTTIVELLDGIINRNVYGGGLGDSIENGYGGNDNIAAIVNSKVYVYVGTAPANPDDPSSEPTGHITINGDVFGCNNINGTPKDDVFVGIYRTFHTSENAYPTDVLTLDGLDVADPDADEYNQKFAINAVYGGGNRASYKPNVVAEGETPHNTTVYVWGCTENTVKTVYGGGNAANVGDTTDAGVHLPANTNILIDGGRFDRIFGGGNGYSAIGNHTDPSLGDYNPGANIFGTATTTINGGLFRQVFGASNQCGDLDSISLIIEKLCDTLLIYETFGGGNEAKITCNLSTTLICSNYMIGNFYGGSNLADIVGNVTLNVRGGNYVNVFGGSKGKADNTATPEDESVSADITGNVTLNLNGGTMVNAFGGCNIKGSIGGYITVNLLDTVTTCPLQVDTIYGGGCDAEYAPNLISGKKIISPVVNLLHGTVGHHEGTDIVHGCVFGGGKGHDAVVTAHPKVIIGDTITTGPDASVHQNYQVTVLGSSTGGGNVFGGGNAAEVDGIDSVLMLKSNNVVVNLFGGGNMAVADTAVVIMTAGTVDTIFGGGNLEGLAGTALINVSGGSVQKGIYGGSNMEGTVADNITVNVTGNTTVGADGASANIHGGGYGSGTHTNGHVTVNFGDTPDTQSAFPKLYGDLYGGSALGEVNDAATDITTLNVLNGTLYGDIYGGGLGDANNPAAVYGKVFVNIGDMVGDVLKGNATFSETTAIFGCNNLNGSPQDSVFVNIYKTAHGSTIQTNAYPTTSITTVAQLAANSLEQTYAIPAVYGGGNLAAYTPTLNGESKPKSATVHVYGCQNNTIEEVYGGGNAADVGTTTVGSTAGIPANTFVIIDGGRINRVFGGGRGDNTTTPQLEANIYGTATTIINAGLIDTIFGGGNMKGDINSINLNLTHNNTSCNDEVFNQVFGGANLAALSGSLNTTINCGVEEVGDIYGGSNLANIGGDVTLNISGGRYNTVFGGSKGSGTVSANIGGKVELNLQGGQMVNAFGGSNVQGNVSGSITVNVLDLGGTCGLQVDTIYGGGLEASYEPDRVSGKKIVSPVVNLLHGKIGEGMVGNVTVAGCVFGGGKGSGASVTSHPKVVIGDTDQENNQITVLGHIFGGGNMATVDGIDSVLVVKANSQVVNLFGGGNRADADSTVVMMSVAASVDTIFGGGNLAGLDGAALVKVSAGTSKGGIYGGNNKSGTVLGNIVVDVTGGTIGTDADHTANVHGGGYGENTKTGSNVEVTIDGASVVIYGDVYGGSALGSVNSGGDTPSVNTSCHTYVTLTSGTIHGDLYGGGLGDNATGNLVEAKVWSPVKVNINGGTVSNVFGCNNKNGAPQSTVQVNIEETTAGTMSVTNVFGGGNLAAYSDTPDVNIIAGTVSGCVFGGGNEAGVGGGDVVMTGGTVLGSLASGVTGTGGVFGGCNTSGNVNGTITVNINGGTIGADGTGNSANVHGGGYGYNTSTTGNVEVTIAGASAVIYGDVYGGSALGSVNSGGDNPSVNTSYHTYVTLTSGTIHGDLYGGGLGQITPSIEAKVWSPVRVNINGGSVTNVFGCNNENGAPQSTVQVNINETTAGTMSVTHVYGGGNKAAYGGKPDVNIIAGTVSGNVFGGGNDINGDSNETSKGVLASDVEMTGGTVLGSIYGGCNVNGTVTTTSEVKILGGTVGSSSALTGGTTSDVFGGGFGENTKVKGNVTVTISRAEGNSAPAAPTIYGDVYGGSALGSVNNNGENTTTVYILDGILATHKTADPDHAGVYSYTGGNVYGGGLGQAGEENVSKGQVNGVVTVNIGSFTPNSAPADEGDHTGNSYSGNATIQGNVYGCNNTNGSPQQNVTVNIYKTAHTDGTNNTPDNTVDGDAFAIANVFGGGNLADYLANKIATVNVYSCDNTIGRTFGGGNAAASNGVITDIKGGRIGQVFGGGNGEVSAANVNGDVNIGIHGGSVGQFFGGSNTSGNIAGTIAIVVDETGCGSLNINEFFCGGNFADIIGGLTTSITCNEHKVVNYLYGGCNKAKIWGDVVLNIYGGEYFEVYGGSKGDLASLNSGSDQTHSDNAADILRYPASNYDWSANPNGYPDALKTFMVAHSELAGTAGNVTLNLYGGSMTNAFGGNNINGNIEGIITVNVLDNGGDCGLEVHNIYGGSNVTAYTPNYTLSGGETERISPVVNLIHGNVSTITDPVTGEVTAGNVFGGSKGSETATATVTACPKVNIGYNANTMGDLDTPNTLLYQLTYNNTNYTSTTQPANFQAVAGGNVYGGGDLAPVVGSTEVTLQKSNSLVSKNLYGGGNMANVSGSTVVNVTGGTVTQDVYGGGALAHVNITDGSTPTHTEGANTSVTLSGGSVRTVYGGGMGSNSGEGTAALVYGNTTVTISDGSISGTNINTTTNPLMGGVFGGCNVRGTVMGSTTVDINGAVGTSANHINVYGGGHGQNTNVQGSVAVTVGANVYGDVYGGSAKGLVNYTFNNNNTPTAPTTGEGITTTVTLSAGTVTGDVYGGGHGLDNHAANVGRAVTVNVNGGTVSAYGTNNADGGNVFGCNNLLGAPKESVQVNINSNVENNVYGGGNLAAYTYTTGNNPDVNINNGTVANVFGGGKGDEQDNTGETAMVTGNPKVTIGDDNASHYAVVTGNVYGGGDAAKVTGNTWVIYNDNNANSSVTKVFGGGNKAGVTGSADVDMVLGTVTAGLYGGCNDKGTVGGLITVDVTGGTIGATGTGNEANVHGGGYGQNTKTNNSVEVTINGASAVIYGDVYGGSALGSVNNGNDNPSVNASYHTYVTLTSGTIHGDLYGGGLGQITPSSIEAKVWSPVQVTVNGGTVTGSVYGCNNLNGAPQSTVKVDIYGTDTPASGYALANVFGGGNMAAYGGTPDVTVHNCDNSIGFVYGGGNKASVVGTNVIVYGGNIGFVFGGGNGEGVAPDFTMVSEDAEANIYGGTIGKVFGGNNNSGAIVGNISVNVDKQTESGHSSCSMIIGEVYGGGNYAAGKAGTIDIGCTGTWTTGHDGHNSTNNRIGYDLEGISTVYGGANQADISNSITLNINDGIVENVFGGNNQSGSIAGTIQVNIEKTGTCDWYVGNVYGGGNLAAYAPTTTTNNPEVNILNGTVSGDVFGGGLGNTAKVRSNPKVTVGSLINSNYAAVVVGNVYGGGSAAMVGDDDQDNPSTNNTVVLVQKSNSSVAKVFGGGMQAGVTGTTGVTITDGNITAGVYGGCNASGTVNGNITVDVTGGTVGTDATHRADIHGGGYGESTATGGNVTVTFGTQGDTHTEYPKLFGDVYGGSALGSVNANANNTTTVHVLNGTLKTDKTSGTTTNGQPYFIYNGGNVFGGGLGQEGSANVNKGKVNGVVTVNIGAASRSGRDLNPENDENIGQAVIEGSVYGCNNTNGSPQDNVTVHIYRTYRGEKDEVTYHADDATFAIPNVFGGGNRANFEPPTTGKELKVFIHGCYNTVERVFGGSNAAAAGTPAVSATNTPEIPVLVKTNIDGGRFYEVFGGGNGEVSPANIYGNVDLQIHGGYVDEFYVGSNQQGSISGSSDVTIDQASECFEVDITEFFCGGKYANFIGDINVTIHCSDDMHVTNLYGGCKEANVVAGNGGTGSIHLVVEGGTYDNIYGGSKGHIDPNNPDNNISADIEGDVLLEVHGGAILNAIYGGCNILGDIAGTITVNVEDKGNAGCPLDVSVADVYGGGNKANYDRTGKPYDYPQVNIKNATVKNVFGGGLEAEVKGNPQVRIKKGSRVLGNVYGGGNMGKVTGDPRVIINGKDNTPNPTW